MRHREIEAARLARAYQKMNKEMRQIRGRQNEFLAELAVRSFNDSIDEIIADETFPSTGNSLLSWVENDPWAVQDHIDRYEAKKALRFINKSETEPNIRWMMDEIKRRKSARMMKHKARGKP